MPKTKSHLSEINRMETLVSDFVQSAKTLVESDHEKVALMYDFLFVGKPNESPPVLPFAALMQRNTEDISSFRKSVNRFAWILVSLLVSAVGIFTLAVYNHVFAAQVISELGR